jgi:hypothetical protein
MDDLDYTNVVVDGLILQGFLYDKRGKIGCTEKGVHHLIKLLTDAFYSTLNGEYDKKQYFISKDDALKMYIEECVKSENPVVLMTKLTNWKLGKITLAEV